MSLAILIQDEALAMGNFWQALPVKKEKIR